MIAPPWEPCPAGLRRDGSCGVIPLRLGMGERLTRRRRATRSLNWYGQTPEKREAHWPLIFSPLVLRKRERWV